MPPSWQATALDADFSDYLPVASSRRLTPGQILGDVRAMPFDDRTFDVVVAVDLLEHVLPVDRPRAVSEICRVTRRRAVIACPVGDAAFAADQRLAERIAARWPTRARLARRASAPWLSGDSDDHRHRLALRDDPRDWERERCRP